MPFCPNCKYEYTSGIAVCPDCNETLVDTLAENKSFTAAVTPDNSWVGVCKIGGQLRSEIAKGALDSNNIPSVLISSSFHNAGGYASLTTGLLPRAAAGEILMVPREYREEAELILEAVLGEDFDRLNSHM
jgi:hypothetical protein